MLTFYVTVVFSLGSYDYSVQFQVIKKKLTSRQEDIIIIKSYKTIKKQDKIREDGYAQEYVRTDRIGAGW